MTWVVSFSILGRFGPRRGRGVASMAWRGVAVTWLARAVAATRRGEIHTHAVVPRRSRAA